MKLVGIFSNKSHFLELFQILLLKVRVLDTHQPKSQLYRFKMQSIFVRPFTRSKIIVSSCKTYNNSTIDKRRFNCQKYDKKLKNNYLECLDHQNVLYLGYIGTVRDEHLYKFGISHRIINRINAHERLFGNFELLFVSAYDRNRQVESIFAKHSKTQLWHRPLEFKGKVQRELIGIHADDKCYQKSAKFIVSHLELICNHDKMHNEATKSPYYYYFF